MGVLSSPFGEVNRFNLEKALLDEEYARNIVVSGEALYDDYIFVLSAIYASNTCISEWITKFKNHRGLFTSLIESAQVVHCYSWEDAVQDIADYCDICVSIPIKQSLESRNYVKEHISPYLLKVLHGRILTEDDVIYALSVFWETTQLSTA